MHVEHKRPPLRGIKFFLKINLWEVLMLILIISLVSTTIGVIIKNLVDLFTKSRKEAFSHKHGKIMRYLFASVGCVCATVFKLTVQVLIFVI